MQRKAQIKKLTAFLGALALFGVIAAIEAQPPAGAPAGMPPAAGRGGAPRGSRFKIYPADAVERGLASYNATCGYCHGERGKGGKAGPDLIASLVTLHDEDGVQIAAYLKGPEHLKAVKVDASDAKVADIAAYLHSRVIYASGRGNVRTSEILVGDAKAGERYFTGEGGCAKCHSPSGDLKGVGAKYDPPTLQERIVMPRSGRGGFGRGAAVNPTAPYAVVTLPSGETLKGTPLRVTDFDVTLRFADGSTKTWARERGIPKVETVDPLQAHIDIMRKLSDTNMHNLTAYLATLQ
jgi:mono/diheme cytochrome c family protein